MINNAKGNELYYTARQHARATIEGWTFEDGDMVVAGKMIGYTGSPKYPFYDTVLHAIGDGWRLLGSPQEFTDSVGKGWEWWLVRE